MSIEDLLGKVFDSAQGSLRDEITPDEYARRRYDFVFHMLDWKTDLEQFATLVDDPHSMKAKDATTFLIGFLYHVVPHLNAAGRLLLDEVPDPFAQKVESRV
jgi:hypothetical protein